MNPLPTILIDVHPVFRQITARVLRQFFADTITLVAEGDHWPLPLPPNVIPQIVLIGLGMYGFIDPKYLADIRTALPDAMLIVLGLLDDPPYRTASLVAGADAFVSKNELGTWLVPVIHDLTHAVSAHA